MVIPKYLNRLIHASPVKYYVSGIDGARVEWPWRMNRAHSTGFRTEYVDACKHHILDSNFKDESVTNADVLDRAYEVESDGAVLADVYQNAEETVDALVDGIELYRDHEFTGTIILPLQRPYKESYDAVMPHAEGIDVWWGLGGLKDPPASVKVNHAKSFRNHVGDATHIHGLGFGVTERLARAVRRNPNLLDSIDNSSAVDAAIGGLKGDEQTTVVAMRAQAKRMENLWRLTHYAGDPDDPKQIRNQQQNGLEAYE